MSTTPESDIGTGIDFIKEQNSEEFVELRKTHRSFVFPMAVFFLLWYFAYVLLADYAHEFMSIKVWGNFTMGCCWACCSSSRPSPSRRPTFPSPTGSLTPRPRPFASASKHKKQGNEREYTDNSCRRPRKHQGRQPVG